MFPKPFGQYAGDTVQFAAFCGFAVMNGVLASKELENQMFNGLKARRQLAAYVALGLSTGGGLLFSAQPAHAAETHDHTVTASSINGFEGSDQTGFMSDNRITIGTAGVTNQPFSTYGIISGGGKTDTASDVTGNTLTIHGLQVSNGNGQSMIYGGVSGTGAVTNNKVFFNNGLSKDSIYGGFNGTSATNAVTGNSVTVVDGTVEGDVQGGGTAGTGAVTGNFVTITGGTLKDEAMGGIIRSTTSSADITGNTLTISGGAFTKSGGTNVFGAYTAGSGKAENNSVTVSNLTNTDLTVYGAHAAGGGNAVNNHVTIGRESTADVLIRQRVRLRAILSPSRRAAGSMTTRTPVGQRVLRTATSLPSRGMLTGRSMAAESMTPVTRQRAMKSASRAAR